LLIVKVREQSREYIYKNVDFSVSKVISHVVGKFLNTNILGKFELLKVLL